MAKEEKPCFGQTMLCGDTQLCLFLPFSSKRPTFWQGAKARFTKSKAFATPRAFQDAHSVPILSSDRPAPVASTESKRCEMSRPLRKIFDPSAKPTFYVSQLLGTHQNMRKRSSGVGNVLVCFEAKERWTCNGAIEEELQCKSSALQELLFWILDNRGWKSSSRFQPLHGLEKKL